METCIRCGRQFEVLFPLPFEPYLESLGIPNPRKMICLACAIELVKSILDWIAGTKGA